MSDVVRDITNGIKAEIAAEAGGSYAELPYVIDIEKNNFRQNNDRYGVLARASTQLPGVTKFITFEHNFEVVLTKAYMESKIDDETKRDKGLDLTELMLRIYQRLVNNKAGVPSSVMNLVNLSVSEPQYLTESKVVALRADFNVIYRIQL